MNERETVTTREEIDLLVETTTVTNGDKSDDTDKFSNTDSSNGDVEENFPDYRRQSEAKRLEENVRREERLIRHYSETIDTAATGAAGAEAEAVREEENTLHYEDDVISYMLKQQNRSDADAEEKQALRIENDAIEYQAEVRAYSRSLEYASKSDDTASAESITTENNAPFGNEDPDEDAKGNPDTSSPDMENWDADATPPESETSETAVTAETEEEISEEIAEELEEEVQESVAKPTRSRASRRAPRRPTPSKPAPKKK